ncbi:hypothetical protein Ocin01_18473, partial [Orchesella cincta]
MCSKMVDSSCNPPLLLGNCQKFDESWNRMGNRVPEGTKGNGNVKLNAPYAVTPLSLPRIPYVPKTVSLNRTPWEGWRYGSNYVNTDETEKPYGYPDYTYYRGNYCGPCCSCVPSIAPLGGDPNGKNPNIRYVQLDYKNLLGSGFATQGPPTSQTSPFMMVIQGLLQVVAVIIVRNALVCIGDQSKPETVQPCPVQPMKIYLPMSMIPRGGPDGDKADDETESSGQCEETESENGSNTAPVLTSMGSNILKYTFLRKGKRITNREIVSVKRFPVLITPSVSLVNLRGYLILAVAAKLAKLPWHVAQNMEPILQDVKSLDHQSSIAKNDSCHFKEFCKP